MAETLVEWAYGRVCARDGLDLKTRQPCILAALTALGGGTSPQLTATIEHTLAVGASKREILGVIWQMAVHGGMPAAINGLNAALAVFGDETA